MDRMRGMHLHPAHPVYVESHAPEREQTMSFSEDELQYLRSQRLARLGTVGPDGQPDVVPVGFQIDGPYIFIPGFDITRTRKYRNIRDGNAKVALTIDDYVSTDPWTPRFVRIYGTAELVEREGPYGRGAAIRITPTVSWSWNLDGQPYTGNTASGALSRGPRKTIHQPPA
jgi:pyridoxamine 5'-phosphate oxidase family protein